MKMSDWAENEVRIACQKEAPNRKEGEFDYGCGCYESALKAFKSICEDGHSRMSVQITANILDRLIAGKPLTAIEDDDDSWTESDSIRHSDGSISYTCSIRHSDGSISYPCKRYWSFTKTVDISGNVIYKDHDRAIGIDIKNGATFSMDLVSDVINEMFPITMPYYPDTKPIKVYCEDFLMDPEHGDFDTLGMLYAVFPDGKRQDIKRYFTEHDGNLIPILEETYFRLKEENKEVYENE